MKSLRFLFVLFIIISSLIIVHYNRFAIKSVHSATSINSSIGNNKFEIENNSTNADVTVKEDDTESIISIVESGVRPNIYKSIFANYALGDLIKIYIEYPQIGYREYEEIDDAINKQLYNAVVTEDITNWRGRRFDAKIKYEVTFCSNDIFSVLFSGYLAPTGTYNEVIHAMTFDFKTGEPINLQDFFSADEMETLISDFIGSEKCTIDPEPFGESAARIVYLKELFLEYFGSESKLSHQNDFYIKEDKLGLIIKEPSPKRTHYIVEFNLSATPKLSD